MGGFMKKIVRKLRDCLASEEYGLKREELVFAAFIIKVNNTKPGWDKEIRKLLRNSKGVRCLKLDGAAGTVEVSGIFNPTKLIKKIGKCRGVGNVQFGQCCGNLFLPPPPTTTTQQDSKKLDPPPPPPPPLQHNYPYNNPSNYYGYALPYDNNNYNCSHNHSLPPPSYYSLYYVGEGDIYGYDDYYQLAEAPPYYYAPPHHYY